MSVLWEKLMRPMLFAADAERAHELGIWALRKGLASPFYVDDPTFGKPPVEVFGLKFANPVGLAAGFDKNCLVVDQVASLGFGFVEVGTVTYRPQPGNPKPRLFRLPADHALLNRLGFNNDGAEVIAERLAKVNRKCVIGVNIGRNKDISNDDAVDNYIASFDLLQPLADYVAINISSPNTPGLRELQQADHLNDLLGALQVRNQKLGHKPLVVKIAPDLDDGGIEAILESCERHAIDGIIATNTTVSRSGLTSPDIEQLGDGGISGRPIADRSNDVISKLHQVSQGKLTIIGVGGIFSAADAQAKIDAGASLVQAYTGFVYQGPGFARMLNQELAKHIASRALHT